MDYALSPDGGKSWKGSKGKVVVFSSLGEAREVATRIANNNGVKVTIGRVTWSKDYYGEKMGVKSISNVETITPGKKDVKPAPKKKAAKKKTI